MAGKATKPVATPSTTEPNSLQIVHRASACRICGGETELAVSGGRGLSPEALAPTYHAPGTHGDLFRCRDCGTVQQPSLPAAGPLHGLYREMRDSAYLNEEAGRRATARALLDLVARHRSMGRLLDVGCGHGLLLDEARGRGYRVHGLELSRTSAAFARHELGLDVSEVALEEFDGGDDARFDVIVLADVLEHLDDPVASLDRCEQLLAPGGALVVITPDPSSLAARVAGSRWWAYIPAHACLIPRRTLAELIAATGLIVAERHALRRTFSLGYWSGGLTERIHGPLARAGEALISRFRERSVSLSLGDEQVVIARKVPVQEPSRAMITDRGAETKVHVVIPAYNAEATVARVAAALPIDAADRALLVDDASGDRTVEAALAAGLEVLAHPTNRGYGANQKACYVRAALDGADVVVMVHGDNQYDPTLARRMVQPIVEGRADVVIGSRLLEDHAVSGGMPRWKWIGNRALTWVENRGFNRAFSEYHTGYRAFSIEFLRSIPFLRNSDDFVFDQEIFAQIIASGARVVELAIPTRYFLEASSVSFRASVVYGLKTLLVLGRFRGHHRRRRWTLLRRPAARLAAQPPPEALRRSGVSGDRLADAEVP